MKCKNLWYRGLSLLIITSMLLLDCVPTLASDSTITTSETATQIPQVADLTDSDLDANLENLTDIIQEYDGSTDYFTGATIVAGEDTALLENQEIQLDNESSMNASTGEITVDPSFFDKLPDVSVKETSTSTQIVEDNTTVVIHDHYIDQYQGNTLVSSYLSSDTDTDDGLVPVAKVAEYLGYSTESTDDGLNITKPFQTKRIIVESSVEPDLLNSIAYTPLYGDTYVLQFETEEDAIAACDYYNSLNTVTYAEPDTIMSTEGTVDESVSADVAAATVTHKSWGVAKMGFDTFNNTLTSTLPTIVVAVVDSGCDMDHSFLTGRLINSGLNLSTTGTAGSPEDDYGHGTHVAGIIADCTLSNVMIMPIKVLNSTGTASTTAISSGIIKATTLGVDVINLSLGGVGSSTTYSAAIDAAVNAGIPVCVAAGNSSVDTETWRPANVTSAFTVSSVNSSLVFSSFSNFGDEVDYCAPGQSVTSSYLDNTFKSMTGTSMATPHIAAACAAVLSYDPNASVSTIEKILDSCVTDLGTAGFDIYYGTGFVAMDTLNLNSFMALTPTFGVTEGAYSSGFSLTLSSESGAKIYYTTDGTTPTQSSQYLYTGPVTISKTCTVKAIATNTGKINSSVNSATYVIGGIDLDSAYTVSNNVLTSYNGVLTEVTIPTSVGGQQILSIAPSAFANHTTLKKITLNSAITAIPASCFQGCTGLTTVVAANATTIGTDAFNGCSALSDIQITGSKITQVYAGAFNGCSSLKTISLPIITYIGVGTFSGCTSLTTVSIPKVTTINSYGFYGCTNLTNIDITESLLTTIDAYAFTNNYNLAENFTLANLTTLGRNAFSDCRSLTGFSASKLTTLNPAVFQNCNGLKTLSLPLITTIGEYALSFESAYPSTFTQVSIPWTNITSIGSYGLQGWSNTTSLALNLTNLTTLDKNAFYRNSGLISIQASILATINQQTFAYCNNLTIGTFPAVTTINEAAFKDDYQAKIIMPAGLTTISGTQCFAMGGDFYTIPSNTLVVFGKSGSVLNTYCTQNTVAFSTLPGIIDEPDNLATLKGSSAAPLSVTAVGFNLTYQWYSATKSDLSDGVLISGATTSTYTPSTSLLGNTYYYVKVSSTDNGVTTIQLSKPAYVEILSTDATLTSLNLTIGGKAYDYGFKSNLLKYTITLPTSYNEGDKITATAGTTTGNTIQSITVTDYTNNIARVTVVIQNSTTGTVNTYVIDVVLTYQKVSQIFSGTSSYSMTYGDTLKKIDTVLTTGTGTLSYTSSNSSVVTVDSQGQITPTGVGSASITVTAAGNYLYLPTTYTVTVTVKAKSLTGLTGTLSNTSYTYDTTAKTPTVTIAGLSLTKDYTVVYLNNINSGYASAIVTGTGNYTDTMTLYYKINPITTTITGTSSYSVQSTVGSFKLNMVTNSTNALTYSSSNTSVATVSDTGTVTILASGEAVITVKADAADNYTYATTNVVIVVNLTTQKVTVPATLSKVYGDAAFSLGATATTPLTYSSSNTSVATVDAKGLVTLTGPGETVITTFAIANDKYASATATTTIKVAPKAMTPITQTAATSTTLTFKWTPQANVTGYQLYLYNSTTATYSLYKTLLGETTASYTVTGLSGQTSYIFKIRSYKNANANTYYGAFSSGVTCVTAPVQVTGVTATAASTSSIKLTWTKITGVNGYQIYRYNSTTKSYTLVATPASTAVSYTVTGLSSGTAYSYVIRGYKTVNSVNYPGIYSAVVTMTTLPATTTISALSTASSVITSTWTSTTASGYELQYATASNFTSSKTVVLNSSTIVTRKLTSLVKGKKYYLRVRSYRTLNGVKFYGSWSTTKAIICK